jgi:hypothetical protein
VIWFLSLTALASAFAYYRVFTGFSEHDSEGFLMTAVQQYLQEYKLYAEIASGYGPV